MPSFPGDFGALRWILPLDVLSYTHTHSVTLLKNEKCLPSLLGYEITNALILRDVGKLSTAGLLFFYLIIQLYLIDTWILTIEINFENTLNDL